MLSKRKFRSEHAGGLRYAQTTPLLHGLSALRSLPRPARPRRLPLDRILLLMPAFAIAFVLIQGSSSVRGSASFEPRMEHYRLRSDQLGLLAGAMIRTNLTCYSLVETQMS